VTEAHTGRVVVLSPHLDDAVLSTWSVLSRSDDVQVINVCTGIPERGLLSQWDRMTGATDSASRMLERLQEDRLALASAGREAVALGFPEMQYRHGSLDAEALREALRRTMDGAVQVWAPAGIGGHDDHVQIRDVALEAARDGGRSLRLYADLPYAVRFGWPGWVSDGDADPHLVIEAWWQRFLPAEVDLSPEKHTLSDGQARRKLEALAAYRTQLPALNAGPVGLLLRGDIIRHEVSWAVQAGAD